MKRERGFSLLEMLVVVLVFTIVTGAVFTLLNVAQQRYKIESELLDAFQGARIALDEITRDVHAAGYPSVKSLTLAQADASSQLVAYTFAWQPGYNTRPSLAAECQLPATCQVPGPYDLILETDLDPENNNGVEWIRYALRGTTLFRGVTSKVAGGNPLALTEPALTPYVENVMNNTSAAEINQIRQSYPNLFATGAVPVFGYAFSPDPPCPTPAVPPLPTQVGCIREVRITLIVRAQGLDPRTRQPRVATLQGVARLINPVPSR